MCVGIKDHNVAMRSITVFIIVVKKENRAVYKKGVSLTLLICSDAAVQRTGLFS